MSKVCKLREQAVLRRMRSSGGLQAGLLGAGAPNTLFKLKRAVFDTEKGQLLFN
jgi:ribosomal protein L25 (general stress protein Ctc)